MVRQRHERRIVAGGARQRNLRRRALGRLGPKDYVRGVAFDVVLPVADRLDVETLKSRLPAITWDRLQGSGVAVPVAAEGLLDELWATHVTSTPYGFPEELPDRLYKEGVVTRVLVNRYERDRAARVACIAHHGTSCLVCGFNFEESYGRVGRDFIHVHHARDISTLGPGYRWTRRSTWYRYAQTATPWHIGLGQH
jgi:5-methylcytosine-specific restriction protein A